MTGERGACRAISLNGNDTSLTIGAVTRTREAALTDRALDGCCGLIGAREQATAPADRATNAHKCFMAALLDWLTWLLWESPAACYTRSAGRDALLSRCPVGGRGRLGRMSHRLRWSPRAGAARSSGIADGRRLGHTRRRAGRSSELRRTRVAQHRPVPRRPRLRWGGRPVGREHLLLRHARRRHLEEHQRGPNVGADFRSDRNGVHRCDRHRRVESADHLRRHRRRDTRRRCLQIDRRREVVDQRRPARHPFHRIHRRQRHQPRRRRRGRDRRPDAEPGARRLPYHRRRQDMDEGALRRRHRRLPIRRRGSRRTAVMYATLYPGTGVRGASLAPPIVPGQPPPAPGGPPFTRAPALFKSTDGGATWTKLAAKGLASPPVGRQALGIVAKSGGRIVLAGLQDGLYRSEDGGETWTRANHDPRITPVGVITDPSNPDLVYVTQTALYRSSDGGRTFEAFAGAPSGDDFQLVWIDPRHSNRLLAGVDQGAVVSVDAGKSWSSWYNQPTGPVLPRGHGRSVSVPRLRRTAGQRIGRRAQPQRFRRDWVSRLVLARRLRVRLSRPRPARSGHRLRRRLVSDRGAVRSAHRPDRARLRAGHEIPIREQRADVLLAAGPAHPLLRHAVHAENVECRHDLG